MTAFNMLSFMAAGVFVFVIGCVFALMIGAILATDDPSETLPPMTWQEHALLDDDLVLALCELREKSGCTEDELAAVLRDKGFVDVVKDTLDEMREEQESKQGSALQRRFNTHE